MIYKAVWFNRRQLHPILTVVADTRHQARCKAQDQLNRPGRESYYEAWNESGKSVVTQEEMSEFLSLETREREIRTNARC